MNDTAKPATRKRVLKPGASFWIGKEEQEDGAEVDLTPEQEIAFADKLVPLDEPQESDEPVDQTIVANPKTTKKK